MAPQPELVMFSVEEPEHVSLKHSKALFTVVLRMKLICLGRTGLLIYIIQMTVAFNGLYASKMFDSH